MMISWTKEGQKVNIGLNVRLSKSDLVIAWVWLSIREDRYSNYRLRISWRKWRVFFKFDEFSEVGYEDWQVKNYLYLRDLCVITREQMLDLKPPSVRPYK